MTDLEPRDPDPTEIPLPTFLVLGAHRAAGRWLRTNLVEHPDVFVTPKPVGYFTDGSWMTGFRGYRNQFRDGVGCAAVGELAPSYLRSTQDLRSLANRIDTRLPDVRLIALVRQPVDRMYSAFRDHVIHGRLPLESDLSAMIRTGDPVLAELDLIGSSLYASNLYPYWRRFGDRLLVVVVDDIRDDPAKVYHRVLEHIGVRTDVTPSRLERVLYSNAASRWTADSIPTDDQRRTLHMRFRADVDELEAMLGRYLPAWDPGPPRPGWEAAHADLDTWYAGGR